MEHDSMPVGYLGRIRQFNRNARLFLLSASVSELSMAAFGVILNIYLRRLGYSNTFLGIFTTVNLLSSGLVSLPAGLFADRFGRKQAVLISIGLAACAALGQVQFTNSPLILLGFSALRGASNTFKGIVRSPMLVENSRPTERMHLFSVSSALSHLSAFAGSSIGGLMPVFVLDALRLTEDIAIMPLRISLLATAMFWLLSALPILKMTEERPARGAERLRLGFYAVLANPVARDLAVHNLLIGGGAGLVVPFFNVFLTEQLQATTSQVGLVMGGAQLVLIVAVLGSPFLVDRFGKVRSVVLTQSASIPLLLTMALAPSIWLVTLSYWLRMALMNMSSPVTNSFAMEIVPAEQRATTASIMSMANNVARAMSATIGGVMMDSFGISSPYFGTAVIYTLAVVFYARRFRQVEERNAEAQLLPGKRSVSEGQLAKTNLYE